MAAPVSHANTFTSNRPSVDVGSIRCVLRSELSDQRKRQREKFLTLKRLKFEPNEEASTVQSIEDDIEKMKDALACLKQGKKLESLRALRGLFCKSEAVGEEFIRGEGLQPLMSCLASSHSEVLHSAAWCAVNLSAGTSASVHRVVCLSPLLIQFLKGSDPVMQELCAWALGNLAGDSPKLRAILMQQGCVPSLVELVASEHNISFIPRTQSAVFALRNFATGSLHCVRCLQDNDIFQAIKTMMGAVTADSLNLLFELGWLINSFYSRPEVYAEWSGQCGEILCVLIEKLAQITTSPEVIFEERILLPFVHCVGNLVGRSPALCVLASERSVFLPTLCGMLQRDDVSLQREVLWLLGNFCAEPSCCVLTMCHPDMLTQITGCCLSHCSGVALDALCLLEVASHVSCHMSHFLLQQRGLVERLGPLLGSLDPAVVDKVVDIVSELVLMAEQKEAISLPDEFISRLQSLTSWKVSQSTKEKAQHLLNMFPTR